MIPFIFLVLAALSYCSAQTSSTLLPPEQFRIFNKLTVNQGLSQNLVLFIRQDKQGFLWFGTAGGLDRFDGIEIKTYRNIPGLKQQPVYFYDCIVNPDSTFWIGTELGIMLFNPVTFSAKMFIPPAPLIYSGGANDIHHLKPVNDSTIFFGVTGKGLLSLNTRTKKFSLACKFESLNGRTSGEDIAGIIPVKENRVLLITYDSIFELDYGTGKVKHIADSLPDLQARCVLYNDKTNSLLIGTSKGVLEFRNNSVRQIILDGISANQMKALSVFSMYRDTKNALWLGTENDGVYYIREGDSAIHYKNNPLDPKTIPPGSILGFFEDRSKNLWLSVSDGGLCRIDLKKEKFNIISNHTGFPKQLTNEIIRDIDIDAEDNLWIVSSGLTYIDRTNQKIGFYPSEEIASQSFAYKTSKVYKMNDTIFAIISNRKIFLYNTKEGKARELTINKKRPASIYLAAVRRKTGNLFCVSPDSIFEINPMKDEYIRTIAKFSEQSIIPPNTSVSYLTEDTEGKVWIATNFGLLCWDDSKGSFAAFSNSSSSEYFLFPESVITTIAFAENKEIWIGTTAGLFRYNPSTKNIKQFSIRDGLINDKIWSIAVDHNKDIWVTSNKGLMKLDETPSGEFSIRSYTIEDGLPSNEFNMNVTATDTKGMIYFGTPNGVVYFHPDSIEDNTRQSRIVLTDLKIYGASVSTGGEISYLNKLEIPYENKVFSIRYASLDFTNPVKHLYKYKLEGYDDRWIDAGGRREAFYTNLNPGIYTLLIKSTNSDGVWNEKPLKVTIEIVPPFWMTWWFRGILILGAIAAIGGSVRYVELRKIRRRIEILEHQHAVERERSRISKDMHDEIGANLTRISLLSNIMTSKAKSTEDISAINEITGSVNETIEKLDEIVWAVNPSNDNLKNFTSYICEYAQNFFEASNIKCRFNISESIPEISLTSEKRHHLFLIIKEALNNVQKYSGARHIIISLIVDKSFFEFIIKDDGKGFYPGAVAESSNGIRNMKERISFIGGNFELISGIGQGTEISLRIFI